MILFVIADMPVAAPSRGATSTIGEHAGGCLEDVSVDALNRFSVAACGQSQEDFLGKILGVAAELRRSARKETIQRAAVPRCQCLNKRLLAPRYAGNGRAAVPPIA